MVDKITLEGARVMAGLTLKEAAKKFGVHWQTLSNWENNPSVMKQKYVERIPTVYYFSTNDIFFGNKYEFILFLENGNKQEVK